MNLEKLISTALLTPMGDPADPDCIWGLPLLLWGSIGIGKSARVRTASRAAGLECAPVFPATRQPEDFSGVPVPNGTGGVNLACILGVVNGLIALNKGVLFADEVSCARPAVQAAFMSLVLDRRIGDTLLPGHIRILAAANPAEEAAGGWELEPPLANRFAHIDVTCPTPDEWTNWLLGGSSVQVKPIEDGEKYVTERWLDTWPKVSGLMAGFMRALGSTHLQRVPAQGHQDRGRAFPTPRTWENAARAVATSMILEDGDKSDTTRLDLVEACVGKGSAVAWASWVSKADLPDPLIMLQEGWPIDKQRLDRTVAAYTGMTAYVLNRKDKEERTRFGGRAWELLDDLCDASLGDLALTPARQLVNAGLGTKACKEARPVMVRFGKTGLGSFIED
jgi:hypothetical protein